MDVYFELYDLCMFRNVRTEFLGLATKIASLKKKIDMYINIWI